MKSLPHYYYQALIIYAQALIIYSQTLKINYQALKIVCICVVISFAIAPDGKAKTVFPIIAAGHYPACSPTHSLNLLAKAMNSS